MRARGDSDMGRVTVEVELANHEDLVRAKDQTISPDQVRRARVSGIVDTGASYLVLPKRLVDQLGVPAAGRVKVRYADQRRAIRPVVSDVEVTLFGRQGTFKAIVEPKRDDVLVGAIVLEDLDLLVDCRTQTLQPRDPKDVLAEIE